MPKAAELTDSEMEGTDAAFPDDTEQDLSPDHAAFLDAQNRANGKPMVGYNDPKDLKNPAYLAAVEKHFGAILYQRLMKQREEMYQPQNKTPEGAPIYNNSVTPSASSLMQTIEAMK